MENLTETTSGAILLMSREEDLNNNLGNNGLTADRPTKPEVSELKPAAETKLFISESSALALKTITKAITPELSDIKPRRARETVAARDIELYLSRA